MDSRALLKKRGKFEKIWMGASEHPLCRKILDRMGFRIVPYYLLLEKLSFVDLSHLSDQFAEYESGFQGPEDMPAMAALPGRNIPLADLLIRLKAGNLCFGMKHHGELVAFTWSDLKRCSSKLRSFPLRQDEAYLYDAYTRESYRGKGVAPYIRWKNYKELAKLGKVNLYSISEYFNTPAVNFKRKLNAKILLFGIYLQFLKRLHVSVPLRRSRVPY